MRKFFLIVFLICVASLDLTVRAQEGKTIVNYKTAKAKLLGQHRLSLQWISWDYFGTAEVTERHGVMRFTGKQKSREDADFLAIDGVITEIDKNHFKFDGKIVTKVSYLNNGEECVRSGEMIFKITGKRQYWRLQQMLNPCTNIETDYVDLYFR